jgi:hypothetical protein
VLANRAQRWLANRPGKPEGAKGPGQDPTIAQLVATSLGTWSPAWDRLTQIAKERKAGQ